MKNKDKVNGLDDLAMGAGSMMSTEQEPYCPDGFDFDNEINGTAQENTVSPAKLVAAVMAKFDGKKRELVKDIGFGGLLELPPINQLHRQFSVWLLGKTRWWSSVIAPGNGINMQFAERHVEIVIGLPSSGHDVLSCALDSEEEKIRFFRTKLSFLGTENEILSNAERIVAEEFPSNATKEKKDQFKIAFVIFVMGRFLATTQDTNIGNSDFWAALSNTEHIRDYNWCSYILHHVKEAARKLQWYKSDETQLPCCVLVLQIFYLDNLDLGPLTLPHNLFPRVKAFDDYAIERMIEADRCNGVSSSGNAAFGASGLRSVVGNCYFRPEEHCKTHGKTALCQSNASTPETSQKAGPSGRKRTFSGTTGTTTPGQTTRKPFKQDPPLSGRNKMLDFSAYLRNKYQDRMDPHILDALKFHNARCLQHANKYKNEWASAIIAENITLAEKIMSHLSKGSGLTIPKYPRSIGSERRKAYEDRLSGPESENEEENRQHISASRKSAKSVATNLSLNKKTYGENVSPIGKIQPYNSPPLTTRSRSYADSALPIDNASSDAASPSATDNKITPAYSASTPAATSKMPPVSPTQSPTTENTRFSEVALSVRMLSSIGTIDLNSRVIDAEYTTSPAEKKKAKVGRFARSHWSMDVDHPDRDQSITHILFDWLATTNSEELQRTWIMHEVPRFIEIKGHELKDQVAGGAGMSYELFDIAVRRLKQLDNYIYPADIPLRWRHLLESDYAMHVLGGSDPTENIPIREQFIGDDVNYEISRCRMIFVPVRSKETWWSYVWDLKGEVVFIIDPTVANTGEEITIMKHAGTIKKIEESLKSTVRGLFIGWSIDSSEFRKVVVRTSIPACKSTESGFYTLYCIKNFDGDKIRNEPTAGAIERFKEYMLYELFTLKQNKVPKPDVYVEMIED